LRPSIDSSTGYLHATYAQSLSEVGRPVLLPRSRGWIIERTIPSSASIDAMGCYPLFCCEDWTLLKDDLSEIENELVSLVLVTDPFGNWTSEGLNETFPDLCRPYKMHNVVDLTSVPPKTLNSNHTRNIKRALDRVEIEVLSEPAQYLRKWKGLYANLVARHEITGVPAFSESSFELQFETPGLWAFGARRDDVIVGIALWYQHGDCAYYHLGAYSDEGYNLSASFGIFWTAIEFFKNNGLRLLDLGAGLDPEGKDGLARFKRGWANAERPVYLCGRIFDRTAYTVLTAASIDKTQTFFPAYRG
jgi:hypothetical protein